MKKLRTKFKTEIGASMVEYSLLIAMISIVTFGALKSVGDSMSTTFNHTGQLVAGGGAGGNIHTGMTGTGAGKN